MLGIDLTRISRFENPKKNFIKKILHEKEILEYMKSNNKPKYLAKRWAAKEALYKMDNSLFAFSKICINTSGGKWKYDSYKISTTSEGDYCYAVATLKEN